MKVAIHQPNYIPWLGYFRKIAQADVFIFLDNVQFSKGGYTNRVRIGMGKWLTVPIKVHLGDKINEVELANDCWIEQHLNLLRNEYMWCKGFDEIYPIVVNLYEDLPQDALVWANITLIENITYQLDIYDYEMHLASDFDLNTKSDDLLIDLVKAVGGDEYLSGSGGKKYQDPEKFERAGIKLTYLDFKHPEYLQAGHPFVKDMGDYPFVAGLSTLDAVFNVGWEKTAEMIKGELR